MQIEFHLEAGEGVTSCSYQYGISSALYHRLSEFNPALVYSIAKIAQGIRISLLNSVQIS